MRNRLRLAVLAIVAAGLTRAYGPVLISGSAHAQLADPSVYDLRRVGRFRVVGRVEPVAIWEAFDEDEPGARSAKRSMLPVHNAALESFESGRVDDAIVSFEKVVQEVPGDQVAADYVARCRDLADRGLPAGWDGVVTLDHK